MKRFQKFLLLTVAKGQLISKCLFGIFNPPKIRLYYLLILNVLSAPVFLECRSAPAPYGKKEWHSQIAPSEKKEWHSKIALS